MQDFDIIFYDKPDGTEPDERIFGQLGRKNEGKNDPHNCNAAKKWL